MDVESLATSPPQWIEISASALRHNAEAFRRVISDRSRLLGVVKANAYGHGVAQVAEVVEDVLDWFGVHSAPEARRLRELGVAKPILVMGFVPPAELEGLDGDVHLLASSLQAMEWIADYRSRTGVSLPVHVKVDTGAKRQGIAVEELQNAVRKAGSLGLEVCGLATHFANIEDTLEHEFALAQLERFHRALDIATAHLGHRPEFVHAACSAAALLFRRTDFSLVRLGVSLYGHWPSRETRLSLRLKLPDQPLELQPALAWRAMVGQLQTVKPGETVGYGRTWTALRETSLAVIPVGYADGYPRHLGNCARVAIRGREAPVVGRVCMNILMVDVTDIPDLALGDTVTLLGTDGAATITAEELAAHCGTINYELLARLSPSIPRVVLR